MNKFEATRLDMGAGHISRSFTGTAKRGTAMGAHLTTETACVVATPTNFLGFALREVTTDGPTLEEQVFPALEFPYKSGEQISLFKALEVEAEGSDFILLSGVGQITTQTAVGTLLSFIAGKFYASQSGDMPFYMLSANNLTPEEAGELRIRAERI